MKIDTGTIEGYAEMTAEQKIAALEAFEYDDNASEVERLRNAVTKANGDAAEWKRKHSELLSEDERQKQTAADELENLKTEVEALRKDKAIANYTAKYIALGYDEKLARETAEAMQSGDMEKVFANGEKHKEALEKKIKADLMNNTPKPGGSSGGDENKADLAVEKAKELARARNGSSKSYNEIMDKYRK